jgi:hypothetical protein
MPRPVKKHKDPKKQKLHEAALARRRAAHAEKRTLEMAAQAAEGQADFQKLVEAEKERIESQATTFARKGGSTPPKVTTQARDNLAKAFDLMGGVPALVVWGRSNPTDFYRLWSRLIPREAAETSTALPLEDLLAKLASREEQSVGQAAYEIGQELLDKGKAAAEAEDAELAKRILN